MTISFQEAELFGLPHSYYTLIARSYLRKQHWTVHEVSSRRPEFGREIVPAIGRGIIPVLKLADGTLIQDSLDIIETGETLLPRLPAMPQGPKQQLVARVFFLYGSQALLKPAMHYRWSYYEDQKAFLDHAFGLADGSAPEKIMDRMKSYLPVLGVTPETIPHIETSFETLLGLLDAHFAKYPYLLGGQPSVGDYGMLGPLCAHLGRDPVPEMLMKRLAPNVYRWTERMNCAGPDMPEYEIEEGFLFGDEVPETLYPVLAFIAEDYGPELTDRIACLRAHQANEAVSDGAPVSEKPAQRAVGFAPVRYRGVTVQMAVQPYLLYCQRRIEAAYAQLNNADKAWADDILLFGEMRSAIDPQLSFTVGRLNNIEVWEAVSGTG
ncbi:MAG: glutathione S-transferase [Ponticaulis sp.]|nr:glutathione S-transferase [Ponticaulis sp.]|tara:strand:- start:20366 stop:21505 length:1140 start_codon:yes stop_codon:yes gene_type:complete